MHLLCQQPTPCHPPLACPRPTPRHISPPCPAPLNHPPPRRRATPRTPESEVTQFHDHGGFTFRNQPLGYWLAYVGSLGGRNSPVLVIQAQCDRPEDERASLPLPPGALDAFPFQKPLRFSAKTDRGRASLDEALADAVTWLRRNQGVDKIGKGRAEVKARLEAMRDDDAGRLPAERRHRLVTQAEFLSLCEQAGNISSPDALLDYLHNCGTVFYRQGLFGDRIILDQAWALDAVYAVFDRARSYRNLQRYRGRFTRSDLGQWIWDAEGYAPEEQELFLSLMQQCGICFRLAMGRRREGIESEYIAPDLLPGREDLEIASELQQKWDERCDAHATLTYELLPPGLMRALISQVGSEAGLAAEYWRDGFYFYDQQLTAKRWSSSAGLKAGPARSASRPSAGRRRCCSTASWGSSTTATSPSALAPPPEPAARARLRRRR